MTIEDDDGSIIREVRDLRVSSVAIGSHVLHGLGQCQEYTATQKLTEPVFA